MLGLRLHFGLFAADQLDGLIEALSLALEPIALVVQPWLDGLRNRRVHRYFLASLRYLTQIFAELTLARQSLAMLLRLLLDSFQVQLFLSLLGLAAALFGDRFASLLIYGGNWYFEVGPGEGREIDLGFVLNFG